jgi:hypothetical protein
VILLLVLSAVVAMVAAVAVSGVGQVYVDIAVDAFRTITDWAKGLFS